MSKRKIASVTGAKSFRHDSDSENDSGDESGESTGGEFSDDSGPEQEGNGEESDYSDAESEASEEPQRKQIDAATSVPLYKRLAEQSTEEAVTAVAREKVKKRRIRDSAKGNYFN